MLMNTIYTQPNMLYSPNGEPSDGNLVSFHEQARSLGRYPKVGLFVQESSDVEDMPPSEIPPPEPRTRPSAVQKPSPSLMSRTLDAPPNAASAQCTQRRGTTASRRQAPPSIQPQPAIPVYRSDNLSEDESPPTSSASSASDYESDYGSSRTRRSKAQRAGPTSSRRARTVKTRIRDAPYSKSSSPTQAIVATTCPPPVSSGSSSSTCSSASISSSSLRLANTDTSDNGKLYHVEHDSSGKIKYVCSTCPDYDTRALGDLNRHFEALAHTMPSHHCVKECGQAFTRKDAVIRHIKTKHPKWKIDYDEEKKQAFWRKGATRPRF